MTDVGIADQVGTVVTTPRNALVDTVIHGKRLAGLKRENAFQLPSVSQGIDKPGGLRRGEIPDIAEDEAMRDVVVGKRAFRPKITSILDAAAAV